MKDETMILYVMVSCIKEYLCKSAARCGAETLPGRCFITRENHDAEVKEGEPGEERFMKLIAKMLQGTGCHEGNQVKQAKGTADCSTLHAICTSVLARCLHIIKSQKEI